MLKYQYIHIWSERKVLNKYFPPDFDPSKIPRRKVVKELQQKVRLMAPFSMQCSTCGDYIYKGKKFNARKERSEGEKYLNIQIYRFYIRCPKCAAEITFKTDPRNTDYVAEHGAVRNFEPWRDQSTTQDAMDSEKAIEEENNPMRALENRTIESKREMDILDALDEIRTKNAHLERIISVNQTEIQANSAEDLAQKLQALQDDEDSKLASSIFQTVDGESVRRIDDDVDLHDLISQSEVAATTSFDIPEQQFKVPKPITSSQSLINSNPSVIGKRKQICTPIDLGIKVRKRTVESVSSSNVVSKSQEKKVATSALVHTLASLATYPDSDED